MLFAPFDTETTGLPGHRLVSLDKQPRVIEFGGIITDGDGVIHQLEFICNPGVAIEPIITEITGLTNADLETKPPFSDFVPALADFFKRAGACIAHNLSFDKNMLKWDLERIGMTLDDINFPKIQICTVEQTAPRFGRRMRLIELYERITGQPYVQKHRALDDVRLMDEMCKVMGVYEIGQNFVHLEWEERE